MANFVFPNLNIGETLHRPRILHIGVSRFLLGSLAAIYQQLDAYTIGVQLRPTPDQDQVAKLIKDTALELPGYEAIEVSPNGNRTSIRLGLSEVISTRLRNPNGSEAGIISRANISAISDRLSDPRLNLTSVSVTAEAYSLTSPEEDARRKADIVNPEFPECVLGVFIQGLLARQLKIQFQIDNPISSRTASVDNRVPLFDVDEKFIIMPFDNVSQNGVKLKALFLEHIDHLIAQYNALASESPEESITSRHLRDANTYVVFKQWFTNNVVIPNTVIDKIVPSREDLETGTVVTSEAAPENVLTIEADAKSNSTLMQLAKVDGVKLVEDITPHEKKKLRLLNAAHFALAILADERNLKTTDVPYKTVIEAINDPDIYARVREFVEFNSLSFTLDPDQSIDRAIKMQFIDELFVRLKNPGIDDTLGRLLQGDVFLKARQRIVEPIAEFRISGRQHTNGPSEILSPGERMLCSWKAYVDRQTGIDVAARIKDTFTDHTLTVLESVLTRNQRGLIGVGAQTSGKTR
mgnify:CR=1 FL=1